MLLLFSTGRDGAVQFMYEGDDFYDDDWDFASKTKGTEESGE